MVNYLDKISSILFRVRQLMRAAPGRRTGWAKRKIVKAEEEIAELKAAIVEDDDESSKDHVAEEFPVPEHLQRNFLLGDANTLGRIEQSIRKNYHVGWRAEKSYTPEAYQKDLLAHLTNRLSEDRTKIVPWLDSVLSLRNQRILEIGCGTGSSTLALAEQGACVTAIDIDEGALVVAQDRCDSYGAKAEFKVLNAQTIATNFGAGSFDHVVFFATLEHMKISERLVSLAAAWTVLAVGGLLTIVETPNRLWHYDSHTSLLSFFHWLPDELAFHYSRMSPRENFRELYRDYDQVSEEHFLRRGRGASFHEIDLAIAPVTSLEVVGSLGHEARSSYSSTDDKFKEVLRALNPTIHDAFFDEYLDLTIRKAEE
jgi:2-polyprenyl-3-methyl-5-hydroxy-6-metoxy-1,4-benzoquinol methylase